MSHQSKISPTEQRTLLERGLSIFAEVHAGEGLTAILLMLNLFLLLTAYLIIKTVREPLILAEGGAVVKSYAAAGQALLLLIIVPAYGSFASRVSRNKLINWVTVFFVKREDVEKPLGKEGGFKLVMGQRYLLLIALLMLVLNLVNTTGEFILGKTVTAEAQKALRREEERVAANGVADRLTDRERKKIEQHFIAKFYANFFFWVNLLAAIIQLFLVSRILKTLGCRPPSSSCQ
ncbi:MAG: hypothetical protein ACE5JU_07255 [Candidatus Binatia bacterium]